MILKHVNLSAILGDAPIVSKHAGPGEHECTAGCIIAIL